MLRYRVRRLPAIALSTVVLMAVAAPGDPGVSRPGGPAQTAAGGLEEVYDAGFVLDDSNGDGHLDSVTARLALPSVPTDAEVAAAANVAARLGYETTALDLPLRRYAGAASEVGPVIAIGAGSLSRLAARISDAELGGELEPGRGTVALVGGTPRTVVLAGGDDAGTRAAALVFAARLPHIWDPEGSTLGDVVNDVRVVLGAAGIEPDGLAVQRLLVEATQNGIDRLDVSVSVPAGSASGAAAALMSARDEPAPPVEAPTDPVDEPETEGAQETVPTLPRLRYVGLRLLRVEVTEPGSDSRLVWISNDTEPADAPGGRAGGGSKDDLDLSNLFTNQGFFGDSDDNLIPDRVDVLLSAASDVSVASADLAGRLGLEAAGVTIPMAKEPDAIDSPADEPPLVLIGSTHPLIAELVDVEDSDVELPELAPGQGWIKVVPEAFGDKTAVLVLGGDANGLDRALRQLAERLPHLWERGKDRSTVEDVEEALWRAVSSRSPAGQAATALYKLETIAARLDGLDLETAVVNVFVEKADPEFEAFLSSRAAELITADDLDVSVGNIDVQDGQLLIDEEIVIDSEVDEFWSRFRAAVLPAVGRGTAVSLDVGLSEPPEIRAAVADQARAALLEAGADPAATSVRVLSAYKQGYSWLYDAVRPALAGQEVQGIRIRFAEVGAPEEWPQQAMYTPTRWLLEIFPIDEVLARDMGLDLEQIVFEKMPKDAPAYEVIATAPDGSEILRETFEPRWVLRPYFDRFPDYEKARVTTGWIHAEVGQRTVIDERIATDLERFWDHFQGDTLMRIYDYVMRNGEGKPRAQDAPHFGELRVDVTLSEPDYQIGVDKEQVASMEALHEEIYFATLHFFDVLGRLARGQALNYPGRVIPVVRPKADGQAGRAKITFTGFGAARPMVVVEYTERDKGPQKLTRDIPKITIDRPTPLDASAIAGQPGLDHLGFYVKVDFEDDRRDEFARRTSTRNIDARITNAAQTTAILANIEALRDAGLYRPSLAFAGLGRIDLTVGWERQRTAETEVTVTLPANGSPAPYPDITAWLPETDDWRAGPLVQWDTPMPPNEAYGVLARMQTWPEATAYQVGESYLGKPIWALDMMAPLAATHWSQAKATTLKPTVVYSARQHANEVSSTSHVLKLAELVLTDPEYADVLDKVNIVIHPITNADGAQLAYDLHQITPDHMLHAGYLGALGVDVTSGQGSPDPIYPETSVRPKLWNTWLPDIFLNPHGYPSHEWVQIFSEYAGWVRTRATESRSWWGMRGWFMPGFSYLDDPRYPDHKDAAFEIRDRITAKINEADDIRALNERAYDRYRRYGYAWDSDAFKLDFTNNVLIYTPIKGGTGRDGTMSNPKVTVWSGTTEAPDETAYGEWLQLVATGGLQWDKALLEYLLEGNHIIDRDKRSVGDAMTFRVTRPRPAKPREPEGAAAPEGRR